MSNAEAVSPGATGMWRRLIAVAGDIKLSHTIFALPFALLATFLAAAHRGELPTLLTIALIIVCMVLARTVAMTMNRWADAAYDAANPRTRRRAVPSGRLPRSWMLGASVISAVGFVIVCDGFWYFNGNPLPFVLSPLVLLWLAGYSFTKRFTSLCHLFLGSALALSPVAAAIAVEPGHLRTPEPWLLAAMVMCWVAGFDVIYALQDVAIDRELGVLSLPATIGVEPALWVSRLLHAISLAALIALGTISAHLGTAFAAGVLAVGGLLVLEHALVWRSESRRINMAFFTVNGVISLLLGTLGVIDVWRNLGS